MKNIFLILFLLIGISVNATTYYVAKTGNDANVGSLASPFLTIGHCINYHLSGQDTLIVRAGTYFETVYPGYLRSVPGISSEHTVIKSYTGETVIIDGTGVVTPDDWPLVYILDPYVDFNGFTVRNTTGGTNGASGIFVHALGIGAIISNCTIHNIWEAGIFIMADSSIAEYNLVYDVNEINSDNIYTPGEFWGQGISASRYPDYAIIRHNIVHDSHGEGISTFEATNTTIEDNIIYDNYSINLYISDATDCLAQRNRLYMTKTMGDGDVIGIGHYNETSSPANVRNTIINNIVYGYKRNLYCSDPLIGLVVANNTFINSTYFASVQINYMAGESNSIFKNNIVIQEDATQCIFYDGTQAGITFSNNLYNKAYDADAVGAGDVTDADNISKTGTYADTSYYILTATAGALDAGASVGINTDYIGALRDASPDIGALEYDAPTSPPAVLSSVITGVITPKSIIASAVGNVLNDGDGTISERGVCWKTSTGPTITDSRTVVSGTTGTFTATLTGLSSNTTYYLRAYATNEIGTAYGSEISFITTIYTPVFSGTKVVVSGGKVVVIK